MNTLNQSRIFISYSHRGRGPEWKAKLLRVLHVFEQQHLLDVWQDGKIRVSSFWDDDIKQAMSSARIAVVLLTREALEVRPAPEANYILDTEFPFLRELQRQGRLTVFPVVCEDCDWRAHDWLRATQTPNESNPLAQLSEAAQDHVFRKLATAISEELSRVALAEHSALSTPQSEGDVRHYLDKFPLARGPGPREEKLIGREQELALLDLAFAQPHTAIVSLVAWGGVGKTMLVQHWLQRLQREGWFGARRVYAWSFYSQGTKEDRQASEDTFLAHALAWFGVQCEPTLSPWDKGRLLADAVARERTLLILDGIEPLQYPPGPMGGQLRAPGVQSLLKQLARKANSVKSENQNSKSQTNCLCLVTTREPLADLADFQRREGSPWGSVLRVDLGNLTYEAGAALLHHAGANRAGAAEIKAHDTELLAASREVDGHALTLNLLGRFLARAHGGDIRRRDLVKFEEADRKEQGGTIFKMLAAFENWFAKSGEFGARQLAVIRMLGLFDRPADDGCIGALRKPPIIAGLTDPLFTTRQDASISQGTMQPVVEEDWSTATSFLADFGLLTIQTDDDNHDTLLDCHPLIREYFAKQLGELNLGTWRSAHQRLYEHLRDTIPEILQPTIQDLQPLYQAVAHGCLAGLHQEALENVYDKRILRGPNHYSWHQLAAYGDELATLTHFYAEPWSRVQSTIRSVDQAWLFTETGFCLRAFGRLADARQPMKHGFEGFAALNEWKDASIAAGNVSELELCLGNVEEAVRFGKESVPLSDLGEKWNWRVMQRTTFAEALLQQGKIQQAASVFADAEAICAENRPSNPLLSAVEGFRFCDLLLSSAEAVAWRIINLDAPKQAKVPLLRKDDGVSACIEAAKRGNLAMKSDAVRARLLDKALNYLIVARAAFLLGLLSKKKQEVDDRSTTRNIFDLAIDGLRVANHAWILPRGLLSRAWFYYSEGNTNAAQTDLDEAWEITARGPMRLHLADIHLCRTRLFFRENPYPWNKDKDGKPRGPADDLADAEKLINECGYHRRDEELADAKRAILGNT